MENNSENTLTEKPDLSENNFHIMIVEDDDDDFWLINKAIENLDWPTNVSRKENGEELFQYLEENQGTSSSSEASGQGNNTDIDLLILDLNMPIMDGRETLKTLRKEAKYNNLPIVILTTSSSKSDHLMTSNLNIMEFCTKPSTFGGFMELIEMLSKFFHNR